MAIGIELIILVVAGFVSVGFVLYVVSVFNALVRLKNDIKKSWANIDVLLKQRSDELPKLIESVKGYMKHEKDVLATLTDARTKFLNAQSMKERADADNAISGALKTIFAVSENYPNLKANESFLQLQNRISGLENELADRREFYNDSVNEYNIRIQSMPDSLIAGVLKYKPEEMFKVAEEDKKDVDVKF